MTPRVEFEIVTARGAVIKTVDERRAATRWAAENAQTFPDLEVFEVTHIAPVRRRVWRDRARLQLVASQ